MNFKSSFFLYLLILFPFQILPQQLPNYPERYFQDSLSLVKSESLSATDGIINPDEYRVGPGDKLFISISGVKEISNYLLIDQEGWLYIPSVGGVDLTNSTLAEAKIKITDSILKYYKNVDIFISLVDFRMIKVSLIGNVLKPSVFVMPSNSRLMDLMTSMKEITETSDIRNIKVISTNNEEKSYDLLKYLRFGDLSNNPFLIEGDAVLVDKIDKVVRISGEVIFPALYEYRSGESIKELIELAGGFTYKARQDTIELVRFVEDGKSQISQYYSSDQLAEMNITLQNKDNVIVRQIILILS